MLDYLPFNLWFKGLDFSLTRTLSCQVLNGGNISPLTGDSLQAGIFLCEAVNINVSSGLHFNFTWSYPAEFSFCPTSKMRSMNSYGDHGPSANSLAHTLSLQTCDDDTSLLCTKLNSKVTVELFKFNGQRKCCDSGANGTFCWSVSVTLVSF